MKIILHLALTNCITVIYITNIQLNANSKDVGFPHQVYKSYSGKIPLATFTFNLAYRFL